MGSMCEGRAVTLKPYSYQPVTVPKPIRPSISSEPYTFLRHAQLCSEAAARREILVQHVLAKRGPVVYCGVIKDAWTTPDGTDCWTIETSFPEKTRVTIPVYNVIQCGGPVCSCVAASERAQRAAAGQEGLTC
jgi:hypothetical protein